MTKMPHFFDELEREAADRRVQDPPQEPAMLTAIELDLGNATEVLSRIAPHVSEWARNPLLREIIEHPPLGMTLDPGQVASVCQIVREIEDAKMHAVPQAAE